MNCQQVFVLLFFLIVINTKIDGRAIEEDHFDQLINNPRSENEEIFSTLVNYRHRFEHSNSMKTLKWMFKQHTNGEEILCKLCHIILPVVNKTFLY